jgi:hypothetical protein
VAAETITFATTDPEGTECTGATPLARHHMPTDWHSRLCGCGDLVGERAPRGEIRDASQRRVQNRSQGLAREECLMPGHDHVREGDEVLITSSGITVLDRSLKKRLASCSYTSIAIPPSWPLFGGHTGERPDDSFFWTWWVVSAGESGGEAEARQARPAGRQVDEDTRRVHVSVDEAPCVETAQCARDGHAHREDPGRPSKAGVPFRTIHAGPNDDRSVGLWQRPRVHVGRSKCAWRSGRHWDVRPESGVTVGAI